jgi:hypothetical protein
MAISYPLSFPNNSSIRSIDLTTRNAIAVSRSPFTYAEQIHSYSGQQWEATVTLKPMVRLEAEAWLAFLVSLRGQYGTFLLGDPGGYSLQSASSPSSATITGTAGSGSLTVSMTGTLVAGDYIQIGSAGSATLHKVLQNQANSGTLEVWPYLRTTYSSTTNLVLTNPRGRFRLASNETNWSLNGLRHYGISFAAMEVI